MKLVSSLEKQSRKERREKNNCLVVGAEIAKFTGKKTSSEKIVKSLKILN